jgi:hypothetical protein
VRWKEDLTGSFWVHKKTGVEVTVIEDYDYTKGVSRKMLVKNRESGREYHSSPETLFRTYRRN